jgi:hypothetical protein
MQTFNEHLAGFATIAEEQRLSCDPYQALYEHAERRISELAVKVGVDSVRIGTIFSVSLFAPFRTFHFFKIPRRFHRQIEYGAPLIDMKNGLNSPILHFD